MTLFVILGATGDLAMKKLYPSIFNLVKKKEIGNFAILGTSNKDTTSSKVLNKSKKYIKNFDKKIFDKLKNNFYYKKVDFYDKNFCNLGEEVRKIEKKHKTKQRIFYLATLPQHFERIALSLRKCNLHKDSKIVFEKPFGNDLKSAKKINKNIKKIFGEEQIYRLDHFLGKELVQNIITLRFTNILLSPLWNKKFIDHIQVVLSEKIGVENRGEFYDKYGAVKDVVQNHMIQLLSLATMETPKHLVAQNIRDEKVKLMRSFKFKKAVLGQYKGYKNEKGVKKNSKTETFAAIEARIENKKWKDVPIYLITGKKMGMKNTSIYIQFKKAPCLLFDKVCNFLPNYLTIQIQPEEGIYARINVKKPGKTNIAPVKMDFCHACTFGPNSPEAYENLFLDVIKGDQSAFIRTDEIEEQWKIAEKIKGKLYTYKKGGMPKKAEFVDWHLEVK